MASKKSKVLAIAFCAAVMSGIYINPVLAYHGQEDFNYQHNTTESGLNNPEIHHTVDEGKFRPDWEPVHPEGDVNCEEEVANSNITVGDMNKVTADLVANDEKIYSDVKDLQEQVNNIETTTDTDTHVKEGAATVDDNGNVTMDIVDKNGKDTGKNVTISGLASDSELEGVKNELQQQIDSIDVEDTDTHIETGEHFADENGDITMDIVDKDGDPTGETVTIKDVASKSDMEVADAGLASDIKDETLNREAADNEIKADLAQETNDRELADKIESTLREWGDEQLQENIEAEAEKREQADNQIKNDLKQETIDRIAGDNALNNAINKETVEREAADTLIREDLAQETNDRIEADKQLQQSIDIQREVIGAGSTDELKGAYSGTNYIKDANNMAEADVILDREISNVNSRVDGIENRVDGLEDRIDKVGAMSAAIANLRTMGYDPAAPTEVAVGVGQYRDETGMALGLFHYPNRDFMLSLSVSTSGDEYMGGIGATWKFGRKSPEKVAEIKKAQAEADARRAEEQKLAKAEEMKKAAKEAKVQAQMERHAKLAAERAALEEA